MTRTAVLLPLAALLAVTLLLELLAGPESGEDIPLPPPAAPAPPPAAPDAAGDPAGLVQTILARPLFSLNRRPAATPDGSAAATSDTLPRLAGVIVGPGGGRAIFAPAEGRPLVLPEGGHIGRYLVRSIVPGQVTLSDAGRDLVIRPSLVKGSMP